MIKHTTLTWVALAIGALTAAGDTHAKGSRPPYNFVPGGTAKFAPIDPKAPHGVQVAVVSGDLKTGPVAFLLKVPKGAAPAHRHTSDYYAVLVEGAAKHWVAEQDAQAQAFPAGTAWFQPGGTVHADECLSDSCLVFVYMANGYDSLLADPAGKK
jgi:quercetin dioxygenase-like cupin family protein